MSIGIKVWLTLATLAFASFMIGAGVWVMTEWLDPFSFWGTVGFVGLLVILFAIVACAIVGICAIWMS